MSFQAEFISKLSKACDYGVILQLKGRFNFYYYFEISVSGIMVFTNIYYKEGIFIEHNFE